LIERILDQRRGLDSLVTAEMLLTDLLPTIDPMGMGSRLAESWQKIYELEKRHRIPRASATNPADRLFDEDDFFDDDFLDQPADFFDDDFFEGTLPPSRRASERPMAMACFRLVTFFPEPLFNLPLLSSCISSSTLSDAFFPYFAMAIPPSGVKNGKQ
jgi:hypothetical protein